VCSENDPMVKIRIRSSTLFGVGAAGSTIDDALAVGGATNFCLGRMITCANHPHGEDESVPLLVHDLPATELRFDASAACYFLGIRPKVDEAAYVSVVRLGDKTFWKAVLSQIRRQVRLLSQGITLDPAGRRRSLPGRLRQIAHAGARLDSMGCCVPAGVRLDNEGTRSSHLSCRSGRRCHGSRRPGMTTPSPPVPTGGDGRRLSRASGFATPPFALGGGGQVRENGTAAKPAVLANGLRHLGCEEASLWHFS
jgi:hypothetical protein